MRSWRVPCLAAGVLAVTVVQAPAQVAATTQPRAVTAAASLSAEMPALPVTLADAVDRAMTFNLGVLSRDEQLTSARGARVRALRDLLPRVDARLAGTRQTTNLAAFGFDASRFPGLSSVVGPFDIVDARLHATQSVLDLAARADLRSRTASVDAARLDAMNEREVVTYVVTTLYWQAVAGQRRIDTARAQLATAEALLHRAEQLRDAGVVAGIDVVRAQVAVSARRQRVVSAESEAAKQQIQLARAMGLPVTQRLTLRDATGRPLTPLASDDALVADALASRSDLGAAQQRVASADAALTRVRNEALPAVGISVDYGTIGSTLPSARPTYALAGQVRVPLFDVDRIGRRMEQAAALEQRRAEERDARARVEAEVRTALLDVRASEQQWAVSRERQRLAEQEVALAQVRFEAGVTGNLELLQAQSEVDAATDDVIASEYAQQVARAALARAVGHTLAP